MLNIAVLSANGQVGCETILNLALRDDVRCVGFSRTHYGTSFLKAVGLPHETYSIADAAKLKDQLASFDVVADLTYPTGKIYEIRSLLKNHIRSVVSAMKPGSTYVYASTIMAFGMSDSTWAVSDHWLSRSSYSSIKRAGEREVDRSSRAHGVRGISLRLGVVHGILQAATAQLRNDLVWNPIEVMHRPDDKTIAVPVRAIADSIRICGQPQTEPGLYTTLSTPQWTVEELYQYLAADLQTKPQINYRPGQKVRLRQKMKSMLSRRADSMRSFLENVAFSRSAWLYNRAKAWHRSRGESGSTVTNLDHKLRHQHHFGDCPGRRLPGIDCSVSSIQSAEEMIRRRYPILQTSNVLSNI